MAGERCSTPNCGRIIVEVAGNIWVHERPVDPARPDVCFSHDDSWSAGPAYEDPSPGYRDPNSGPRRIF